MTEAAMTEIFQLYCLCTNIFTRYVAYSKELEWTQWKIPKNNDNKQYKPFKCVFLNGGPNRLDVFYSQQGLHGCTLNTAPKPGPTMHLIRLFLSWTRLVSCE